LWPAGDFAVYRWDAGCSAQEAYFARAFADGDPGIARDLYQPDVVYVSPTVRLFDWPAQIEGIEHTLEFIALTIRGCTDIRYQATELAIVPGAEVAFVRVQFDWTSGEQRLRSTYVVIYRYRDGSSITTRAGRCSDSVEAGSHRRMRTGRESGTLDGS